MSKKLLKKIKKVAIIKESFFLKKKYTNLKQLNLKVLGEELGKMAMRTCLDFDICLTCQHWHLWNKLNFCLNFVFHPEKMKSRLKKYERIFVQYPEEQSASFVRGKRKILMA